MVVRERVCVGIVGDSRVSTASPVWGGGLDGSPSWATVLSVEADFRTPGGLPTASWEVDHVPSGFVWRRGFPMRRDGSGAVEGRRSDLVRAVALLAAVVLRRWPGRSAAVVRGVSPWVRWRTPIPP